MAAQVLEAAHRDMPELANELAQGNYRVLVKWLTTHIYQHGRAYTITELLERISGRDLQVQPYLDSLQTKYSDLYNL